MPSDIVLIGPVRTGKTTVAHLLSAHLGLPRVGLDELRWRYYEELGYRADVAKRIRQTGGFVALVYYWKQFDAYAVERALAEHRHCVFDFGAGHSVYDSREQLARVQAALSEYPNVVLLLPAAEAEESIRILDERTKDLTGAYGQGFNWNEHFVRHRSNYALAKKTVYTAGKTPEDTRDDVLALIAG